MMRYLLIALLVLQCSTFQKKEEPKIEPIKTEVIEKEAVSPLVERMTIMISSFAKDENQISLEPAKQTDRKKLDFFIERLENNEYLKLDFQIIPIKNIVRYKAEIITKRYGKNNSVTETVKLVISTSNKEEFVEQLKNIIK